MISKLLLIATICGSRGIALGIPLYATAIQVQKTSDGLPILAPYSSPVYGAPFSGNFARLSTSQVPTQQVANFASLAPCATPCIIESVAQVVPVSQPINYPKVSQIIAAYGPPTVQNVVEPKKNEDNGYEYSYVVVDEDTGDQKAQQESSDGSVVRGQYSLIQPDGYIREVQYTADDVSGFNAIVKNFLPKSAEVASVEKANLKKVPEYYTDYNVQEQPKTDTSKNIYDDKKKKLASADPKETREKSTELIPLDDTESSEPNKIYLTLEDIIRCANLLRTPNANENIDSAKPETQTENPVKTGSPTEQNNSALTYIILPSLGLNKPC